MRRIVCLAAVLVVATAMSAQAMQSASPPAVAGAENQNLTQGEFAALLLKTLATKESAELPPAAALARAQQLELVPDGWHADQLLTQQDMADALQALGIEFQPGNPKSPVSRAFAEALLRRHQPEFRRYGQSRFTHGNSEALVTDEGVDRAVSPSQF